MASKILILGRGFIGTRLQEYFQCPADARKIHSFADASVPIERYRPRILINCIGSTGENNVDDCEKDVDNTLWANTFVPIMLADLAYRRKLKLVHISSGCIYHYDFLKNNPLTEAAPPDFHDLFYSRSKIYSENALLSMTTCENALIVRIRVPLDNRKNPRNLLDKLIRFRRVIDVPNSVTYIPDFLKAMAHLIKKDCRGIYNVVNTGPLRYPQLMEAYRKFVPGYVYERVDMKDLKMTRTNLILSTAKLKESGFNVRPIKGVLEECVREWLKSS